MSKVKSKQKNHIDLTVGELALRIDSRGNILLRKAGEISLAFTAKDLDQIADRCRKLFGLRGRIETILKKEIGEYRGPETDRSGNGYDVVFDGDPDIEFILDEIGYDDGVNIGCQYIDKLDVARVHKVSLAMRNRNRK